MIGGKAPFKAVHCAIFCALPRHLFSVAWSAPVIEGVERREQNFIDGYSAEICSSLYTGQQGQHHAASYKYSIQSCILDISEPAMRQRCVDFVCLYSKIFFSHFK